MLDLVSSISLLAQSIVLELHNVLPMAVPPVELMIKTATGKPLPIVDCIHAEVCITHMESSFEKVYCSQ